MAFIQHGDFTPNSNVKGFATNKLSQLHNILHRRLMEPQDSPNYMEDVCYQIPETLHDENLALFMFCIIIYLQFCKGIMGIRSWCPKFSQLDHLTQFQLISTLQRLVRPADYNKLQNFFQFVLQKVVAKSFRGMISTNWIQFKVFPCFHECVVASHDFSCSLVYYSCSDSDNDLKMSWLILIVRLPWSDHSFSVIESLKNMLNKFLQCPPACRDCWKFLASIT